MRFKRLVSVAVAVTLVCSTMLNYPVGVMAEEESTTVATSEKSTVEGTEKVEDTTVSEVSTEPTSKVEDKSETETETETTTEEETSKKYTTSDISISIAMVGTFIKNGNEVIYNGTTNEAYFGISGVGLQNADDGTILKSIEVYYQDGEEKKTLYTRDVSEGINSTSVIPFRFVKNFKNDLLLRYTLSNGQVLEEGLITRCRDWNRTTKFVEDNGLDTLEFSEITAKVVKINGKDTVITTNGLVRYNVNDVNGIKKVTFSEGSNRHEVTPENGKANMLLSWFDDGEHTVTITAEDNVKNTKTVTYTFKLDTSSPEIKGTSFSPTDFGIKDGVVYTNKTLEFGLEDYSDDGRINAVYLRKTEGTRVTDTAIEKGSNSFSISENGTYSLVVKTALDEDIKYDLEELYEGVTSKIIIDKSAPSISFKIDGRPLESISDWITKTSEVSELFSDNYNIAEVKVRVNNTEFVVPYEMITGMTISSVLDLAKDVPAAGDGKYSISVYVKDYAGNIGEMEYNIKCDFSSPVVDMSVEGSYKEVDGKLYVDGSLVVGTRNDSYDIGSGIASTELIKDGEVVGSNAPFSITEDGEYAVRITDGVGHVTEVALKDLIGDVNSSWVLFDSKAPVIEYVSGFIPDLVDGETKWYRISPMLKYRVTDDYMESIDIFFNDLHLVSEVREDNTYVIPTMGSMGELHVTVTATDKYGHTSTDTFSWSADLSSPEVQSATISEDYLVRGDTLFFKRNPTLYVTAKDYGGVGLGQYVLSGSKNETNDNGTFVLGDGEYFLEVKDRLGNSTKLQSIKDLVGLESNNIIVDGEDPKISAKSPSGDTNKWYAGDVTYDVGLSDNQGIKSASVTINGEKVTSYESDNITTTSAKISASTSKVSADDNGMYQVKVDVVDNAGNTNSWSDTIYIDKVAPKISKIIFTGTGNKDGENIKDGNNRYGFYFRGSAVCEVEVTDGKVTSGLNKLYVTMTQDGKKDIQKTLNVSDGTAKFTIPEDFKGFVSVYATDKVGNESRSNSPEGVITESTKFFKNNTAISISFPTTKYKDISGTRLYSSNISANAVIGSDFSGIREIKWGIGDDTLGTVKVSNSGKATGDIGSVHSIKKDKNLVVSMSEDLSLKGNENGLKVWVEVEDRAGYTSRSTKSFSIDKDKPVVSVKYNKSNKTNYYNSNRVATITVNERNFDAKLFSVVGTAGTLGTWSHDGDKWVNTITFSKDGDYKYSLECTDKAGNRASVYRSEKFTIDKTNPTINVSWSGDTSRNGNYYSSSRTATITVVERNFSAGNINFRGNGTLGAWSTKGNTHTARVTFSNNGTYSFSVNGKDNAGNALHSYSSNKFIIDQSKPSLKITGVQDNVSYKKDVTFTVKMSDSYIDTSASRVTLKGDRQGTIDLTSSLNSKTGEFSLLNLPKEEKYDGVYTLSAVVADMAGNTVKKEITFSVNRFGSSYKFLSDKVLGAYLSKVNDISIEEYNVDKLDTTKTKISVILDGKELSLDDSLLSVKEEKKKNKYLYTYVVDKKAFTKDGKYLIQVYSASKDGTNYSSVAEEYSFVLDTKSPEAIISGIEADKSYKDYSKKVTIDVRDISDIKSLDVYLNGNKVDVKNDGGIYSLEVKENTGEQDLKVVAVDLAGNSVTSSVEGFTITSNWWTYLLTQSWFIAVLVALGIILLLVLAFIIRGILISRKEESEVLEQNAKLYVTTSSAGSATSDTKDRVENLDKDN